VAEVGKGSVVDGRVGRVSEPACPCPTVGRPPACACKWAQKSPPPERYPDRDL
jgi:hypothetical protein